MPPDLIAAIITEAERIFGFATDIEITAEANPTSVRGYAKLAGFKSAGVIVYRLEFRRLIQRSCTFLDGNIP